MVESATQEMRCPNCRALVALTPGFVNWCEACDWNVDPMPPPKLSWRERRAAESSARRSRQLFEQISRNGVKGPPRRLTVLNLVALMVHLLTVLVLVTGLAVLIDGFGLWLPVRIVIGGLLVGVAAVVQPFWSRSRSKAKPLTAADAPQLFSLIEEISKELGCRGVDGILISGAFNASIGHSRKHGWVMTIGLPLWVTLEPQEKVAVIGHELGHQLNNDQRTGLLVGGAAATMSRWAYLLKPATHPGAKVMRRGRNMGSGVASLAEPLAILLMLPLAAAAAGLAWLLEVLAARQGLTAEYYADALGARVAGTNASVASLEKLLLSAACTRQLIHNAKFNRDADPWQEIAAYAASIPPQEMERQRRLGRLRLPAIDDSHPPTQLRADLIRSLPYETPKVALDAGRRAAIERELQGAIKAVTRRLRSQYPG